MKSIVLITVLREALQAFVPSRPKGYNILSTYVLVHLKQSYYQLRKERILANI